MRRRFLIVARHGSFDSIFARAWTRKGAERRIQDQLQWEAGIDERRLKRTPPGGRPVPPWVGPTYEVQEIP